MLFHAQFQKFALVTVVVIMQSAGPVFAQGLGQSGWSTPGENAGAGGGAGLGQSSWSMPVQAQTAGGGLGQSQWATGGQGNQVSTAQFGASSGQLGQSTWSAPGQAMGQVQGSIQPIQNAGQSSWSGQQGMPATPRAQTTNTGMSPMDWVNANRAIAAKAKEQHAQRMNQSQWSPAAAFSGSNSFNSAAMSPTNSSQDPAVDLTGSVSQVDIVGDSAAFQAANDSPYGRITPRGSSYQGSAGNGEAAGEGVGEPVGEPVEGAAPSMQEMMASMMAVPMMMAANAGLLGQGFGRPTVGGFRSYSGGGVAMTPRTMGMGIAGYSIGRMANRLGNQLARQAMRNVGR